MKVLIVGGGIGGLALGAFLNKSDIEYDIIEKCTDWSHHGYLISLWDNGRDILKKLGLADEFDGAGSRVQTYSIRDGSGRILRNYSLSHLYSEFGGAVTIIGRKELHGMLLNRIPSERLSMGRSINALEQRHGSVSVTFSDGATGTYDAVIGADGVHSKVRSLVFKEEIEKYTNWRAWYAWIDNAYNVPATVVEYVEAKEFIVIFSTGGKTLANLIAPADHTIWDNAEGRMERLKQLFKDESHIIPAALEKLKADDVLPTDLIDVSMRSITNGRIALIGDAAHSFGPLAGLGSSMALEDAYILAAELMKAETTDVLSALRAYELRSKKRTAIARRVTYKLRAMILTTSTFFMRLIKIAAPFVPERFLVADFRQLLKEEI